ncbi:MAG: LysR family transcriptional regulator [Rhodocyclales bacterium]|nr:LysR family transcriptional regulator [Rhodocyclales bacterium]
MNVTLRQLRAFLAVARFGSFTVAAEHLYTTQSTLSGSIKELENALGVQLFDRNTRRVQLTEVGRELYPLMEKILADLDEVLHEVATLKALKRGIVRIAAPQLMAATLLPEVLASFMREFPHVTIHLIDCGVESVPSCVLSGEADLGVGPERDIPGEIEAEPLFVQAFHVVFPPAHPLAAQQVVPWRRLAEFPLITLQGQFTEKLSRDLHEVVRDLDLHPDTTVAFMSTALAMVSIGLGVTICVSYAEPMVRRYGLEMRRLTEPDVHRRFCVFTRHGRALSPAAEAFRTHLRRFVGNGTAPGA